MKNLSNLTVVRTSVVHQSNFSNWVFMWKRREAFWSQQEFLHQSLVPLNAIATGPIRWFLLLSSDQSSPRAPSSLLCVASVFQSFLVVSRCAPLKFHSRARPGRLLLKRWYRSCSHIFHFEQQTQVFSLWSKLFSFSIFVLVFRWLLKLFYLSDQLFVLLMKLAENKTKINSRKNSLCSFSAHCCWCFLYTLGQLA